MNPAIVVLAVIALGASSNSATPGVGLPKSDHWKRDRPLAFGQGQVWMLLGSKSKSEVRFKLPAGWQAESVVALAMDDVVFTSTGPRNGQAKLWHWKLGNDAPPAQIGGEHGRHSDPFATPDGSWIYFAHNPQLDGPPGAHDRRASAEIWRVRPTGADLSKVTSGHGCHIAPTTDAIGKVFFVQTPCDGRRAVFVLGDPSGRTQLTAYGSYINETAASPDGTRVLMSGVDSFGARIQELDVKRQKQSERLAFKRTMGAVRAQYGENISEVVYQDAGAVWRLVGSKRTRLTLIREGDR